MTRLVKQLIFGGIYLLLIGGFVWWVYRGLVPAPTCTDGVQNGQEEGVDCGAAACSKLCAPAVKPLTILPSQLIANPNGSYDIVATVDNPNTTYGASRVDYALTISDGSGTQLAVRRGNTYVNAAEKRQLVFTFIDPSGTPAKADLQVDPAAVQWALLNLEDGGAVSFSVKSDQLTSGATSLRYQATATNRSVYDFDAVDVTVLLYDAGGKLVGAGTTVINTLLAGEDRAFVVDWPFAIPAAVRAQAVVTTNVFNNDNYIRTHGTDQQF